LSLDVKDRPIIVIGGMQATMSPEVFRAMADYVFIGDGDDHLGEILDALERGERPHSQYLISAETENVPHPAECEPSPFRMSKGGKRDVTRIEIARGCVCRCSFCALSNLKPYREVSYADVVPLLDGVKGMVSMFAPERTMHREWPQIRAEIQRRGLRDLGQDARLERLLDCLL